MLRPSLATVAVVVVGWVVVVSALHVTVNRRGPAARSGEVRTLQVGGLPVT